MKKENEHPKIFVTPIDPGNTVLFTPSNRLLTSFGTDIYWYYENLREYEILKGQQNYYICSLDISQDEKYIAAIHYDGLISVWDIESGKVICTMQTDFNEKGRVLISPDGLIVIGNGFYDGRLFVYRLQKAERFWQSSKLIPVADLTLIKIDKDGMAANQKGSKYKSSFIGIMAGDYLVKAYGDMRFSPSNGNLIVAYDEALGFWNFQTFHLERVIPFPYSRNILNTSKNYIAATTQSDYLHVSRYSDSSIALIKEQVDGNIQTIAFTPEENFLFVGTDEKKLYTFNIQERKIVNEIILKESPVCIAVNRDGNKIVVRNNKYSIEIFSKSALALN